MIFWMSSGRSSTTSPLNTRKSGIVPGKSAESNSTLLPGRSSACRVNGANTPAASNSPFEKAAAASAVGQARELDVGLAHADRVEPLQQQEVVDDAGLGRHGLAGQVLDRVDGLVDDDGVVAGRVVVDQHDHLVVAGRHADQRVVERLAVGVELAGAERGERGQVVVEPLELDLDPDLLEEALLLGDRPREPPGPGRVAEGDRLAGRSGVAAVGRGLVVIVAARGGRDAQKQRERRGEPTGAPRPAGSGRGHVREDLQRRLSYTRGP